MVEKNLVVKAASALGRALGSFQRSRMLAMHGATRDQVIGGLVESSKYRSSDYSSLAAQKRAIQSSWVYIAITKIAQEFAASTFEVVRHSGQPEDEDVPIKNHPLEVLLNVRPNPYMGSAFFWEYLAWWLELNGNTYIYIGVNNFGRVEELWPLPAGEVEVMPGDEERFVDYYIYRARGHEYHIPAEYVVHIRFPNPFDIFRGLSPLVAAMMSVDADRGMSQWNAAFFTQDNVMPSAVINLSSGDPERPIDPADAESLKQDLKADYQAHRRKTAVTTAYKIEVEQLGWSQKDLDFVEGRRFTKEEIFNIYGVPLAFLSADATYSNAESAYKILRDNIWPVMILVAEQITVELIQPFYGMDQAGRFQDIRTGNREMELQEIQSGTDYLTLDEVRADYWGKKPLPDGRGQWTGRESSALEANLAIIIEKEEKKREAIEAAAQARKPKGEKQPQPKQLAQPKETESTPAKPKQLPAGEEKVEEDLLVEEEAKEDLKRWRRKSLNHIKAHRELPIYFQSAWIPDTTMRRIRLRLFSLDQTESTNPSDIANEVRTLFDSEANLLFPFA